MPANAAAKPTAQASRRAAPAVSPFSAQFMAPLLGQPVPLAPAQESAVDKPARQAGHTAAWQAPARRGSASPGTAPSAAAPRRTGALALGEHGQGQVVSARALSSGPTGHAKAASAQGLAAANPAASVVHRLVTAEHPTRQPATLLAGGPGHSVPGLTHPLAETLGDQLTLAARRVQAPLAYIQGEERLTWSEVERATDHLACGLLALGLKRGDRLGVLAPNQIAWMLLFHAATRIGVAVVALSLGEDDASLAHLLSDSGTQVVFTAPHWSGHDLLALLGRLQPQLPQLRHVISLAGDGLNSFASLAATPIDVVRLAQARRQVQPGDLAAVLYGPVPDGPRDAQGAQPRPRGAGLSHRSLLAAAAGHAVHLRISDGDLLHLALPLHQVGGLGCATLPLMLGGGSLVLVPDGRAERLLALMARHRPTLVAARPDTLEQLLAQDSPGRVDWQQVRLVCAGGAAVSADLHHRLAERMPRAEVMSVYGLTEASGAVAITRWQAPPQERRHTVGACLPGWQVRVVDAAGRALPAGQPGELWLQGPGLVPGYVGAAAGQGFSADGWFMTGDLGVVDAQGAITLHGRLSAAPVAEAHRRRKSAAPALRAA